ncbi:Protein DSF2 [Neolecta irregularis DAH-3]|uniref:Protein DSF2 n=1 Tax=Neolecta irregularis (strain DAH-3) TaxID=1198029 RepID=A0A1U7LMQ0_NEOID|nr:Protein DSF2 [Neolecta irregularis DAH-3]|eukprot:OLL23950.1 Protein DSF2 [Neolecta irregularis DAH-3]
MSTGQFDFHTVIQDYSDLSPLDAIAAHSKLLLKNRRDPSADRLSIESSSPFYYSDKLSPLENPEEELSEEFESLHLEKSSPVERADTQILHSGPQRGVERSVSQKVCNSTSTNEPYRRSKTVSYGPPPPRSTSRGRSIISERRPSFNYSRPTSSQNSSSPPLSIPRIIKVTDKPQDTVVRPSVHELTPQIDVDINGRFTPFSWPDGTVARCESPSTGRRHQPAIASILTQSETSQPLPKISLVSPTRGDMTASQHVTKAITHHEAGQLAQSTHHLRLAAQSGHPTGMLLYGLSLRHGWGIAANPTEAVIWLRKATEQVDLDTIMSNQRDSQLEGWVLEGFNGKASLALAIFELGVSHREGWGVQKDPKFALRCFEIAGRLNDVDGCTEAAWCYTNGFGTKRNLKRAAKWYRTAQKLGYNAVGNSWIWKEKYMDSDEEDRGKADDLGKKSSTKSLLKLGRS